MAFKKKSKAPKKKSKSAKKDDWTFEGGMSIAETSKENDEDGPRKRRQTQDRDERLRRGRAKINERNKKKQFTAKMSKKIKFSDVLEKPVVEQSNEESAAKIIKEVRLNPLSVTDRLQLFVSKSMNNAAFRNLHHNEHDSENESFNDSDEDVSGGSDNDVNENGKLMQADETVDHDVDVDDGDEQHSDDDEEEETRAGGACSQQINAVVNTNYDWFFSSRSGPVVAGEKKNKMKLLRSLSDLECDVFGNLHPSVANVPDTYSSLACVPGLNKLWRSGSSSEVEFGTTNGELLPFLGTYADAIIESRDRERDAELLHTMVVHAATHVVKARAAVIKHNQKLKRRAKDAALVAALAGAKEEGQKRKSRKGQPIQAAAAVTEPIVAADGTALSLAAGGEDIAAEEEAAQDQGFSRPRVLILCPFRGSAVEVVECLQRFLGPNTSVSGLDKLGDEFGPPDEDANEEEVDYGAQGGGGGKKRSRDGTQSKPADWEALFKGRNIDDDFKIGIQVNPGHGKGSGADKGVYLRLFSDFFISDIVLASPIGLRLVLESAGSNSESRRSADKPSSVGDFLSSVEMVLLHQADVLYMQNWDHVDYVLRHTNLLPKGNHDTDFARVRPYFLEANGASHRQLLMTTAFVEPELQAFFREHGRSQAGAIRVKREWAEGSIAEVLHPVKQVFQLVPGVNSVATHEDVRFAYFRDTVLAQVLRLEQKHTLIVTPSYLNYVRVRSELMHQQANAAYVCEYSRDSEISRGRSRFFHGTKDILLYSGRAHFFRRFLIRGARHLIFYSLPEYAHFYAEMVNLLDTTGGSSGADGAVSCLVLYTPYERMALERVVGRERCEHMMSSKKATFMFC